MAVQQSAVPSDVVVTLIVLDNGSHQPDWDLLREGLIRLNVAWVRQDTNTGFAAGHNIVIQRAIACQVDYVWLLNNDALVKPDTLGALLLAITQFPDCGVVSPLIYAQHDERVVDFVGAAHDWPTLEIKHAADLESARSMEASKSKDFFVFGTAPLIRTEALRAIGLLNEDLFAYFEDTEFCARLAQHGWSRRMAYSTAIQHVRRKHAFAERPPYFFYLMARNSLFFYLLHTPPEFRRWIRLRLFCRALITAANLRSHGLTEKSNACLLGIWDGLRGRWGPPRLDQPTPAWLTLASKMLPYRVQQWLERVLAR